MTETLRICEGLPHTFRIWVGPTLVLFLIRPEDMQIVLNADTCLRKSFVYSFLHKDVALFTAPRKNSEEQNARRMNLFQKQINI